MILFGAGCTGFQSKEPPKVEPVSVECQPVNDGYTYDADDFYGWLSHVRRFPIATKYERLMTTPEGVGESSESWTARLMTASDCGEDRVTEFSGRPQSEGAGLDIVVFLAKESAPAITHALPGFCEARTNDVFCAFKSTDSLAEVLKLKPFIKDVIDVVEQG
jgi:hypothetical protein